MPNKKTAPAPKRYKFQWTIWKEGTNLGYGHASSQEDCELAARVRMQEVGHRNMVWLHVAQKDDWSDAVKIALHPPQK